MIENSTSGFRAGIVGRGRPTEHFNTFRAKRELNFGYESEDYYYDHDAFGLISNFQVSKLENCFSRNGKIKNFEIFEEIWRRIIDRCVDDDPEDLKFMFPKPCGYGKKDIEDILALVFEEFEFMSFFLKDEGCLSLLSKALLNGVSVDSGKSTSKVSCVFEGYKLESSKFLKRATTPLAGDSVSDYLRQNLDFPSYLNHRTIEQIKASFCKAFDPESDSYGQKRHYKLPDGSSIEIGSERFLAVNQLFYKGGDGWDSPLQNLVETSIKSCDESIRRSLSRSIFLSGGSSRISGLEKKLQSELSGLGRVRVVKNDSCYPIWEGAFLCEDVLAKEFIQRGDYEEHGPNIIHRKCF